MQLQRSSFTARFLFWCLVLTAACSQSHDTPPSDASATSTTARLATACPDLSTVPYQGPSQPLEHLDKAGRLPTRSHVTRRGTLSYTIPIAAPPARSGFTPSVSLTYGSNAGPSPIGKGWTATPPSISRCRSNLSNDTHVAPVVYDNIEGRFCLGGNRLVELGKVAPLPSWFPPIFPTWPRREYVLERDDNTRVFEYRYEGEHIAGWAVLRPTGKVDFFGTSPYSNGIDTDTSNTLSWHLSESYDSRHNAIVYNYVRDAQVLGASFTGTARLLLPLAPELSLGVTDTRPHSQLNSESSLAMQFLMSLTVPAGAVCISDAPPLISESLSEHDSVTAAVDAACDVLSEVDGLEFRLEFADEPWPVDVWVDLCVVMEQMPGLLGRLGARSVILHFYEQGMDRAIEFSEIRDGNIRLSSSGENVVGQVVEVSHEQVTSMILSLCSDFIEAVRNLAPGVFMEPHFQQWAESLSDGIHFLVHRRDSPDGV